MKSLVFSFVMLFCSAGALMADVRCPAAFRGGDPFPYFDGQSGKLREFAVAWTEYSIQRWMPDIIAQGERIHGQKVELEVEISAEEQCSASFLVPQRAMPWVNQKGNIQIPRSFAELLMMRVEDWALAEDLLLAQIPNLLAGGSQAEDAVRCALLMMNFDHTSNNPPRLVDICGTAKQQWFDAYGARRQSPEAMKELGIDFSHAMYFALAHEYAHVLLEHFDPNKQIADVALLRENEIEADLFAYRAYSEDDVGGDGVAHMLLVNAIQSDAVKLSGVAELAELPKENSGASARYLASRCRAGEVLNRLNQDIKITGFVANNHEETLMIEAIQLISETSPEFSTIIKDWAVFCGEFPY